MAYSGIRNPISHIERWGFVFALIPVRYLVCLWEQADPLITASNHSLTQTLDKRILYVTSAVFSIKLNWKKSNSSCNY